MDERVARTIAEFRSQKQHVSQQVSQQCPLKDPKNPAVQRALAAVTRRAADAEKELEECRRVSVDTECRHGKNAV